MTRSQWVLGQDSHGCPGVCLSVQPPVNRLLLPPFNSHRLHPSSHNNVNQSSEGTITSQVTAKRTRHTTLSRDSCQLNQHSEVNDQAVGIQLVLLCWGLVTPGHTDANCLLDLSTLHSYVEGAHSWEWTVIGWWVVGDCDTFILMPKTRIPKHTWPPVIYNLWSCILQEQSLTGEAIAWKDRWCMW